MSAAAPGALVVGAAGAVVWAEPLVLSLSSPHPANTMPAKARPASGMILLRRPMVYLSQCTMSVGSLTRQKFQLSTPERDRLVAR